MQNFSTLDTSTTTSSTTTQNDGTTNGSNKLHTDEIMEELLGTVFAISEPTITPSLFAICFSITHSNLEQLYSMLSREWSFTVSTLAKLLQHFERHIIHKRELIKIVNDNDRLHQSQCSLSSVMCHMKICSKYLKLMKVTSTTLVANQLIEKETWFNFLLYCCQKDMPESFHDEALQSITHFGALFPDYFSEHVVPQIFELASTGKILIEVDGDIDIVFIACNVAASAKFPSAYARVVEPYLNRYIIATQSPPKEYEYVFMFPLCCGLNVFSEEYQAILAKQFIHHFLNGNDPSFLSRLIYVIDVSARDFKRKQDSAWFFTNISRSMFVILDRLIVIAKMRNEPTLRHTALNVIGRTCFAANFADTHWRDISYQLFWDILQIEIEEKQTSNVLNVVTLFKASHESFYGRLRHEHEPKMNEMCQKIFTSLLEYDTNEETNVVKMAILDLLESVLLYGISTVNSMHTLYVWNLLRSIGANITLEKLDLGAKCLHYFAQCFRVISKKESFLTLFGEDWMALSTVITHCLSSTNYYQINATFMFLGRITLKSALLQIEIVGKSKIPIDTLTYLVERSTTEFSRICITNAEEIALCQKTKRDISYFISTLVLRYYNKQNDEDRIKLMTVLKHFLIASVDEDLLEYMTKADEEIYRTYLMLSVDAICNIMMIDMNALSPALFYERLGETFLPVMQIHITSTSRAQRSLYVFLKKLEGTLQSHIHFITHRSKWFLIEVIERKMQEIVDSGSAHLFQLYAPTAHRVLTSLKLHIFDPSDDEDDEAIV